MICADDDVPFGESSCVSCGTCLQVCPTGALIDRHSAYMGHESQVKRTAGRLPGLRRRLRHRGPHPRQPAAPRRGRLGRPQRRPALRDRPLRRRRAPAASASSSRWSARTAQLVETSWDEALTHRGREVQEAAARRRPGLAAADQRIAGRVRLLLPRGPRQRRGRPALRRGAAAGPRQPGVAAATSPTPTASSSSAAIPLKDQKVVGYLIKRAFDQRRQADRRQRRADRPGRLRPRAPAPAGHLAHGASPFERTADDLSPARQRPDPAQQRRRGRPAPGGALRPRPEHHGLRRPAGPAATRCGSCRWSRAPTPSARPGSGLTSRARCTATRCTCWLGDDMPNGQPTLAAAAVHRRAGRLPLRAGPRRPTWCCRPASGPSRTAT